MMHHTTYIFVLFKKHGLDPEILKNYRFVANLSFISKIIEKVIVTHIVKALRRTYESL